MDGEDDDEILIEEPDCQKAGRRHLLTRSETQKASLPIEPLDGLKG